MQLLIHIVVNGDDKNQLILMQIAEDLYLFDPLVRDSMRSRISLTFCISEYIILGPVGMEGDGAHVFSRNKN